MIPEPVIGTVKLSWESCQTVKAISALKSPEKLTQLPLDTWAIEHTIYRYDCCYSNIWSARGWVMYPMLWFSFNQVWQYLRSVLQHKSTQRFKDSDEEFDFRMVSKEFGEIGDEGDPFGQQWCVDDNSVELAAIGDKIFWWTIYCKPYLTDSILRRY